MKVSDLFPNPRPRLDEEHSSNEVLEKFLNSRSSAQVTRSNIFKHIEKALQKEEKLNKSREWDYITEFDKLEQVLKACKDEGWSGKKLDSLSNKFYELVHSIYGNREFAKNLYKRSVAHNFNYNKQTIANHIAFSRKYGHDHPEYKSIENPGTEEARESLMQLLSIKNLDDEDTVAHAIINEWNSHAFRNDPDKFLSILKKAKLPYYSSLMRDVFDTKHIVAYIKSLDREYHTGDGIRMMTALIRAGVERKEYEVIFKDMIKQMLEQGYFTSLGAALTSIRSVNKDWGNVITKDDIVKAVLKAYKKSIDSMGDNLKVKSAIDAFRKAGYDYPEFAAIEKSIRK